ncbi:MAG: hypothetical protein NT010_01290 [Proteobacteria bacterium]|nr:hypothetical protein [Pseudomonadota bacterium]
MENGQFQGLKCCFFGQFVIKGYNMDSLMSELVSYDRRSEDLYKAIAATVAAIAQISAKSIKTMFYGLSLFKLTIIFL